jgi:hypothetical protein
VRLALVLISSLLLVIGCTTSVAVDGVPAPSESASAIPEERFVPNVKGSLVDEARAHLERRGFRVVVRETSGSACVAEGLVMSQDPPPRYIREVGSKVTVYVNGGGLGQCGLGLPEAEPALAAAGLAFVDFARGGVPDEALLRHPVRLYLAGRLMHTLPSWRAVHRNAYGWLCPAAGNLGGLGCPFSATRIIRRSPGRMAVTSEAPQHPCLHGGTLAQRKKRTVTMTPDESLSCVGYFAVELEVGNAGDLVAVNLVATEP